MSYAWSNIYWSVQQSEVHPKCFVTPRSPEEVSTVMKTLTARNAPFTVKGGGHTPFAGSSNLADGVTIDLTYLNDITVSADRLTVSVGGGCRWSNVSEALDPLNLTVVGGRTAEVGVAGLILGGGLSYFSGMKGMACDNVRNFQVVVASGDIVNASPTENTDLYWALRGGGGSNFGIVTRFDLESFEQGDVWSNSLIFPGASNATLISLFRDLTVNDLPNDPAAHSYISMAHLPSLGGYVMNVGLYHATQTSEESMPEVFSPFKSLPDAIDNVTLVANVSTHFKAIHIPYGFRQTWWNTVISATSVPLLLDIVSLFEARNAPLLAAEGGNTVNPLLLIQALPVNVLTEMQKNGGNALGLEPSQGPLYLVSVVTTWEDPQMDEAIESSSQEILAEIERIADERDLGTGFVYMNYAGSTQKVFRGYGKENLRRLKAVAKKWDPRGKLAKLWPGHFKLKGGTC